MSVGNRRRSATTACLALCCLYLVLSLVDRRRELLRRAQAKLDQEVQDQFDEAVLQDEEREMLRGPAKVMPGDPRLIKIIKSHYLHQPFSLFTYPPKDEQQQQQQQQQQKQQRIKGLQSSFIDRLLGGKTKGFFVEASTSLSKQSNSLYFELMRGWTGLLVEPDREKFETLNKKRRAYAVNACLSKNEWPEEVNFVPHESNETEDYFKLPEEEDNVKGEIGLNHTTKTQQRRVQCLPLYSLLLSLDNPTVDYMSLSLNGTELQVLKTIPFDKVKIHVISVDVSDSEAKSIVELLTGHSYRVVRRLGDDIVFQKM